MGGNLAQSERVAQIVRTAALLEAFEIRFGRLTDWQRVKQVPPEDRLRNVCEKLEHDEADEYVDGLNGSVTKHVGYAQMKWTNHLLMGRVFSITSEKTKSWLDHHHQKCNLVLKDNFSQKNT